MTGGKATKHIVETIAKVIFLICAAVAIVAVLSITVYMFAKGTPALAKVGVIDLLFGTVWQPTAATPSYGILYIILTSIVGTAVAILIGVPIGILTAVFITEVSNKKLAAIVQPAVELLAAIPSVIYGLLGLMVLAVGIWFLVQPKVVVSLIPIVIGLVLIFHSIRSIIEAVDARKYGYGGWSVGLIFSIISLIFGIICVTNAFDVMKTATVVVGIILIFNGVSNIWITSRATKAESAYNKQKEFEATFVEDRKEDN